MSIIFFAALIEALIKYGMFLLIGAILFLYIAIKIIRKLLGKPSPQEVDRSHLPFY